MKVLMERNVLTLTTLATLPRCYARILIRNCHSLHILSDFKVASMPFLGCGTTPQTPNRTKEGCGEENVRRDVAKISMTPERYWSDSEVAPFLQKYKSLSPESDFWGAQLP